MIQKYKLSVHKKERLDIFLREQLPLVVNPSLKDDLSNSKIRRLIIAGAVFVNGRQILKPSFDLYVNSTVDINFDEEKFLYEKTPDDIKFEVTEKSVLYEDENLIFIDKPAFFPVEQTITGNRDNLHDAIVRYLWNKNPELRNPPYVGIMHRLDRETSGVIIFTKSRTVNKAVHDLFENHQTVKEYLAIVTPDSKAVKKFKEDFVGKKITVEKYMGRISSKSQAAKWGFLSEKNGGVYSKTEFEFLKEVVVENTKCLLVKCILHTGRTHQIRVHLSEEGFPLLGDTLYGGKSAKRIYLHCTKLAGNIQTDLYSKRFDINSSFCYND